MPRRQSNFRELPPLFRVFWESWDEGCERIEAASEEEARKLFEELIGGLAPTSQGLAIIEIDTVDGADDSQT